MQLMKRHIVCSTHLPAHNLCSDLDLEDLVEAELSLVKWVSTHAELHILFFDIMTMLNIHVLLMNQRSK